MVCVCWVHSCLLIKTDGSLFRCSRARNFNEFFNIQQNKPRLKDQMEIYFDSGHLSESNIIYIAFSVRGGVKQSCSLS